MQWAECVARVAKSSRETSTEDVSWDISVCINNFSEIW